MCLHYFFWENYTHIFSNPKKAITMNKNKQEIDIIKLTIAIVVATILVVLLRNLIFSTLTSI